YEIELRLYLSGIQYINLAFIIIEEYQISDSQDSNQENILGQSKGNDIKLDDENITIPQEWLFGSIIFVGCIIGSALVILKRYRKENFAGLTFMPK
ncbi:MAG: hypothetical protein ACFFAO_18790, partial [Candidatus Hermodarchaeota archaeon]